MSGHNGLKILCLDGGDARCMSQLYILQEYMHRLEHKIGGSILPCEHFDLIAAVDSSSPIAVFLGLFRMSVEDAQQAFHEVYSAVFANENESSDSRAQHLENEIKKLLDIHNIPHTKRLSEFASPHSSKLALCYSPAARLDSCKFFRTYQSPQQLTQDVTVIEALRASWATPEIMPAIFIGPKGRKEAVMSAINSFRNPIREVIKEAYQAFGPKTEVSSLLSLGSGFLGIVTLRDGEIVSRGAITESERIAKEVARGLARFNVYYRLSVDHGLEGWGSFGAEFGAMKSHVDEYLQGDDSSSNLDRCISAATTAGRLSLERIYGAKTRGTRSGHGLPPLSAYFVMRKQPMKVIIKGLIEGSAPGRRIMVISGLGGSGKTQLALKFARDFQDSYQHILFIDASSPESIRKELVSRVRSMRTTYPPATYEDALNILSDPEEETDKDYLIIFDNADDPDTSISNYIPSCDHGSILITTRNPAVGNIAPNSHLKLGSMGETEAVEILLSSAFPTGTMTSDPALQTEKAAPTPTRRDHEAASEIAKALGCLPIAVVQAGCYIQQHQALHHYLDRLNANRLDLLQRNTSIHLDRLKYPHGVYASFNIILQGLSIRALQLLGVLSFFHFSNFPRPLFAIAVKSKFTYEYLELMDRPADFAAPIQFLTGILCPGGNWKESELDGLLEELQKYSLVTLVPIHNIVTLRFHPLVHSWARDRLSAEEQLIHRAAAVRLFVCGITRDNDFGTWEYLQPHINSFISILSALHVNDQAAILGLLWGEGQDNLCLETWKHICDIVEAQHGRNHIQTTRALLGLAGAYDKSGDTTRMETLEREVITIRNGILGSGHLETAIAKANLARTLRDKGEYHDAEILEEEVLRVRLKTLGLAHRDTAGGMMELAATYRCMHRYTDEGGLLSGAVTIYTKVAGELVRSTVSALDQLSECHHLNGQPRKAEQLKEKVLLLRQKLHGERHLSTVTSMKWLATQYQEQGRYQEAEALRRAEVETRTRLQGDQHSETLDAIHWLARSCFELKRHEEAERLLTGELAGRRVIEGDTHVNTLSSMRWLARSYLELKQYDEAEKLFKEELAGRRATQGTTHVSTLAAMSWLAFSCFELKRYEEAESLWEEYLAVSPANQGDTHTSTQGNLGVEALNAMSWLARTYFKLNRYEKAKNLWRDELAGRRAIQGDTHSDTRVSMAWLAHAYFQLEEYEEAKDLWIDILARYRANQDDARAITITPTYWLGHSCFKLKQYDEAQKLWREELASRRAIHGDTHDRTLTSVTWLARSCFELKQYQEAEELWREELAGRRTTQGSIHVNTLSAMFWVARACFELKNYEEAEQLLKERLMGQIGPDAEKLFPSGAHIRMAYTHHQLARLYHHTGRHPEAKDAVAEAIRLRTENLKPDHPDLLESLDLSNIISPDNQPEVVNTPLSLDEGDSGSTSGGDLSAPDPGGDPTYIPSSQISPTIFSTRPQSAFFLRSAFGSRPNSWSMF